MMRRFSRRRRGGSEGRGRTIEAGEWLPKLLEHGVIEAARLEPWAESGVPDSVAAIGRGEGPDGSALIVAFSPGSATEALLGGLAAAQRAVETDSFAGEVKIVAPQWPSGARRLLGLLGRLPYGLEPVVAAGLGGDRVIVDVEPAAPLLTLNAAQLAARLATPELRVAFGRAAQALEGLAAKHGGCVRAGADRLELVVLARRVAELRLENEGIVLETQIGGRTTTPLSGADLAGAFDGLEGQLRRRLNDRKVREGEEGLRGRLVAELATGHELRSLRPWPLPGSELDEIDAVGLGAEGEPVVVAVREELDWAALANVLEALAPVEALLPVLFAEAAPPLRLGRQRLLLVSARFAEGLERALSALVLPFELRDVASTSGARVDLVSRAAGEGAQPRPGRRGRRRGGRGRSGFDEGRGDADERPSSREPAEDDADDRGDAEELAAEERGSEADENGGRGRRGRRRRGRRGGRGAESEGADLEREASGRESRELREGRESREGRDARDAEDGGGEGGRRRRRFEEVSLMDLDDGPGDDEGERAQEGESRGRRGRSRRRGRRSGRRGGAGDEGEATAEAPSEEESAEVVTEEDLVDADDLSEILARLPDDVPEFEGGEARAPAYDDEEEDEEERGRGGRGPAPRAVEDPIDEVRAAMRRRSAVLVHADPDSLFAAILLARDIRQLEGLWIYPQSELMTFFRSIATDLRDDTPIFVIGFTPSPARDVVQASSLYRGRLHWFDRHAWPPEDLMALRGSLGADAVMGGDGLDSTLPLVLETCSRRSRFSDKLVDLATGRFTQHDFERWGRLWRARAEEISRKTGDIRSDLAPLLAGRPSDLAKEAAARELPPPPPEVAWIAERDFRLVYFGSHVMVVLEVDASLDVHLAARIARERYDATLSLARRVDDETFVFAGDEGTGKRALDYLAVSEHLAEKLEWVEARPDADHVARFRVRDLARHPERMEEILAEIAMGRSLLER